jgi:endonuclease YncB( thermonuclease family)
LAYKPDISKSDELKAVETAAKEAKKGLWSACVVRVLSGGRKQTNDLP